MATARPSLRMPLRGRAWPYVPRSLIPSGTITLAGLRSYSRTPTDSVKVGNMFWHWICSYRGNHCSFRSNPSFYFPLFLEGSIANLGLAAPATTMMDPTLLGSSNGTAMAAPLLPPTRALPTGLSYSHTSPLRFSIQI